MPEARAEAMKNYKCPKTQKQLRAFLGALGYYRRFISDFAKLSRVLTPSTSPNAPKTVQWTSQMEEAFVSLKSMLCKYVILTVPNVTDHFQVQTDASHQGLGALLNVIREGKEYPVCFFSRQLCGAEKNYSAMEIEALGVVEAVKHRTHFLYGQRFEVLTDHRALCYFTTLQHLNKRLRGFALRLTMYDCSIQYRPGTTNANADGLLRQAWETPEESDCSSSFLCLPDRRSSLEGGDVGPEQGKGRKKARVK